MVGRAGSQHAGHFAPAAREARLSVKLLRMPGLLAAFSGLYVSVTAGDDTYRKEFFEVVLAKIRQALAVRAACLAALAEVGEGRRMRDSV